MLPFGNRASAVTAPSTPSPSGCHVVPSQRAMLSTMAKSATSNEPPATRLPFGSTRSAYTGPYGPLAPGPGNQSIPHWAASDVESAAAATKEEREDARREGQAIGISLRTRRGEGSQ